ncbi:MAG: BTAD domain-containing putative transcriptional regulator [Eubacteriales bacterium]|nr:BTAD domain-containing putative transcriptional regulator [Eubacteriales bacterium]
MRRNKLYVQMLGDFSLVYMGERLTLERNNYTKAAQLLQYLLYRHGQPIHRDELVRLLYVDGEVASPQNNLKVNIFRLRRLISETGLPDGQYIVQSHGCYAWEGEVDVEVDAFRFERLALEALGTQAVSEEREAMLLRAAEAYTGDFLPMLGFSGWARAEADRYRELYVRVVSEAARLLTRDGSGDGARELLHRAVGHCPDCEELQTQYIYTLLGNRLFREAMDTYTAAERQLSMTDDWQPSPALSALGRRISGDLLGADEVVDLLVRDNPGAESREENCSCSYSVFVSCFNYARSIAARGKQCPYLVLCTLRERNGFMPEQNAHLERAAGALRAGMSGSLHDSDLLARYSPSQYLILMGNATRQECEKTAQWLKERYSRLTPEPNIQLITDVAPILESPENLEALHG